MVQSASLTAPLTAAYKGSTSMRGARGALGFLVRSVWRDVRLGKVPEESVGVVETFISLGRIVPAMMAVEARRCGAQCVEMCALRSGRGAGQMRVRFVEQAESGGTATAGTARLF